MFPAKLTDDKIPHEDLNADTDLATNFCTFLTISGIDSNALLG